MSRPRFLDTISPEERAAVLATHPTKIPVEVLRELVFAEVRGELDGTDFARRLRDPYSIEAWARIVEGEIDSIKSKSDRAWADLRAKQIPDAATYEKEFAELEKREAAGAWFQRRLQRRDQEIERLRRLYDTGGSVIGNLIEEFERADNEEYRKGIAFAIRVIQSKAQA